MSNTLNQYSEPGSRGEPVDPVRPPVAEAPVIPGNPAPTAESPTSIEPTEATISDRLAIIDSYNESLTQPVRERRASMSPEEMEVASDVWVYPPFTPSHSSPAITEVYGQTLENNLGITTSGTFIEYPEPGGNTLMNYFARRIEYSLGAPYTSSMVELNGGPESSPKDIATYYTPVYEAFKSANFSDIEQDGELAQYLDGWFYENLSFIAGENANRDDALNADYDPNIVILSDIASYSELQLDDDGNQTITMPIQFSKSHGENQGDAAFDVTFKAFPQDIDGDGENDSYRWLVVDSASHTPDN